MENPPRDRLQPRSNAPQWSSADVLIVDDNVAYRRALGLVVEYAGYVLVGEAATGEEALEMARSTRPQVILMDVHMPGINGVAAARRISADFPNVAIVLMTVTVDEALEAELSAAGLECVRKERITPYSLAGLITAAQN